MAAAAAAAAAAASPASLVVPAAAEVEATEEGDGEDAESLLLASPSGLTARGLTAAPAAVAGVAAEMVGGLQLE